VDKEVADLIQQLKTAIKTGKLPDGLRIRLRADLIRTADENGPGKNHHEYWEFTAKKLYRLEPKGKEWIKREFKAYDKKQLAKILLKSNFQTIGYSDDKGLGTLFAGTDFNLGDRSVDFIVDNHSILNIGESCVGGTLSPKDSKRFAQLYENLITVAREKQTEKSKPVKINNCLPMMWQCH
jgi:hypothetical protein